VTTERTATDNHAGVPTFLDAASLATLSYTARISFDAGTAPGRANGALMRFFNAGDNLDIVVSVW